MQLLTEILNLYKKLLNIAIVEYKTIVESGEVFYSQAKVPWKLRLYICDGSFIEIYYSTKGKYSYHWDRRLITNKIYRHDNAPHKKWNDVNTFPKHFHDGLEDIVISSYISDNPESALKEFLTFVSEHIKKELPKQ